MTEFKDHFSGHAVDYARYRPRYPDALFSELASRAPSLGAAWDCATGNGQAAIGLAAHFARVVATDASAGQVMQAQPHPRVGYRVAPADASGLESGSMDIVTVAQALHWLDLPSFYAEVKRVLKPLGVLAVWCYGRLQLEGEALQRMIDEYYGVTVGPYWPEGRHLVEEGYRSLDFPFQEAALPPLAMEVRMDLDALIGYVGTWSATQRYAKAAGSDPLPRLRRALLPEWGEAETTRAVRWPLSVRAGHYDPS